MTRRSHEPLDVRLIREGFQRWPLARGKRFLLKMARNWLDRRDFIFQLEPGIVLPPEFDDLMTYWAFVDGMRGWDAVMHLSRAMIRSGDTIVDVGANVGIWTLGAARRAGKHGRAVAFEPVVDNVRRLKRNLMLNGLENVQCEQRVVSDVVGRVTFYQPRGGHSGLGSLSARDEVDLPIEAVSTTLDQYCAEAGVGRIDFLKVDVEGAELAVFSGAAGTLSSPDAPAIMFEANDTLAQGMGGSTADVKSLLSSHGYRVYQVGARHLSEVARNASHAGEDLLALKPHHLVRHAALLPR
jgi:FkbM family methyltransferase